MTAQFEEARPQQKRYKIFIYGPPGTFKTRTLLRLASGPKSEPSMLAVVDTEMGSDHYAAEYKFSRIQTADPDKILEAITSVVAKPGDIRTLGFDTWSVYNEAVVSKYADLFLKRELRSAGHRSEYYNIQPKDFQVINRELSRTVRLLLKSDLNVVCICQQKDVWGDSMKIEGTSWDGWKRLGFYFDVVLEVVQADKKKNTFKVLVHKDRSYHLTKNESYPWGTDAENCAWLTKAGFNLTGGPAAESFIDADEPTATATATAFQSATVDPSVQALADDPPPVTAPQSVGAAAAAATATKDHPAADALEKSAAAVAQSKDDLLHEVVQLKQACRINGSEWPKYIKPFKVSTAKDMTNSQLMELICTLKEVKNAPARTAA